ncbi:DUF4190 domain-containing protein [Mycobacterium sp. 21AC1]|uniref:DUF4190 domain-containing protein n=1 Tax=[Mycobacterium] appelbergii TaxID=2939269 RepID=UPI00293950BC|nr:DUF4190 domain-containing protein [Mycobacterium sp. 21AC1]MDV3129235.1 DUF4190 domain-containing protein [Mycobacterium sp. 21AC1]
MTDERAAGTESDRPEQSQPPSAAVPPYPYGAYPGGYPPPPPYGGYPPPYPGAMTPPPAAPKNGLGIAALVTAIIGLVLVWSVIGGLALGVAAVILGFVARGRVKRGEANNGGVATTGIALGCVAIVLSLVFIAIWVNLGQRWFNEFGGSDYVNCMQDAGSDQAAQQQCEDTFRQRLEGEFGVTPTPSR